MTATTTAKAPPRIAIRTFWLLHRAAYRLTGGRFGLSRPEAGARFGMLWLTTVGRRSGRTRRTMIGYFQDGPNLVTLAMNGWGDADPAWWLNLQAMPQATVETPGGARTVRARAAEGEERVRLWATFRDYPGWGDDLDGLAGRRPRPTPVVVLEPADRIEREVHVGAGPVPPRSASRDDTAAAVIESREGRRLRMRHLWLLPGLAIAIHASGVAQAHGLGLVPLLLFSVVPHLPSLIGVTDPRPAGHIAQRAVPLFNATHHLAPPVVLLGLAAVGLLAPFWLVGALAWISHIVIDWAIGAGSRAADGGVQPHPLARLLADIGSRVTAQSLGSAR